MRSQFQWISIEFKCFIRNYTAVFFTLIFPPLLLVIFGEIYGNDPLPMFDNLGTIDACTPAYICMVICVAGIMSLPLSLTGYREKKILKRFKASPASPWQIIVAQIIVNFLMTMVGTILLLLIAKFRYEITFSGNVMQVLLAYLLCVISVFSIGFFVASIIHNAQAAMAVSNVIYFPMLFLSGATIPIETMPDTIKDISKYIPLSYAVDLMKSTWQGGKIFDDATSIIVLGSIAIVCIAFSLLFFSWDSE